MRQNLFVGHKIPLGETDAFAPLPALEGRFMVRCDECGRSIYTNPQTCEDTNNIFLSLSLPMRYLAIEGTVPRGGCHWVKKWCYTASRAECFAQK
jgi:hypothetical protein